MSKATKK